LRRYGSKKIVEDAKIIQHKYTVASAMVRGKLGSSIKKTKESGRAANTTIRLWWPAQIVVDAMGNCDGAPSPN